MMRYTVYNSFSGVIHIIYWKVSLSFSLFLTALHCLIGSLIWMAKFIKTMKLFRKLNLNSLGVFPLFLGVTTWTVVNCSYYEYCILNISYLNFFFFNPAKTCANNRYWSMWQSQTTWCISKLQKSCNHTDAYHNKSNFFNKTGYLSVMRFLKTFRVITVFCIGMETSEQTCGFWLN